MDDLYDIYLRSNGQILKILIEENDIERCNIILV